jgi:tetrahydromethanopterin S-methyltransferase subunit G
MRADQPIIKERLATVEQKCIEMHGYIFNGLTHRIGRIETALYFLVVGVAGTLLGVVLEILTR